MWSFIFMIEMNFRSAKAITFQHGLKNLNWVKRKNKWIWISNIFFFYLQPEPQLHNFSHFVWVIGSYSTKLEVIYWEQFIWSPQNKKNPQWCGLMTLRYCLLVVKKNRHISIADKNEKLLFMKTINNIFFEQFTFKRNLFTKVNVIKTNFSEFYSLVEHVLKVCMNELITIRNVCIVLYLLYLFA